MEKPSTDPTWDIVIGDSPLVATAIHAGSVVRSDALAAMNLSEAGRLREEDPFTDRLIQDFPSRVVVHRSRFEIDLNRAIAESVYLTEDQSWGLKVWASAPDPAIVDHSVELHRRFYADLKRALRQIEQRHGRFVVIDVHSYNHRRDGAQAAATKQDMAPDINIGTFSMDRERWSGVVDAFIGELRHHGVKGRPIDVRENISFQGKGEQTRFIHENFPQSGCAIAVEFKKIFMDEWTGEPDDDAVDELRRALASTIPVLERALLASS